MCVNTGVVGYMISQLPGSLLLSRGKPRIILPLMMYVPARYLLSPCRRDLPLTCLYLLKGFVGAFLRFACRSLRTLRDSWYAVFSLDYLKVSWFFAFVFEKRRES
jgi:hypothetical protein